MEQDHIYRRTCTCDACQATSLQALLPNSSAGLPDIQPGDQSPSKTTATVVDGAQSNPKCDSDSITASGRGALPGTSNNTAIAEQLLQLALAGRLPAATCSTNPRDDTSAAAVSSGECGRVLLPPAPGKKAAAILAAAEAAVDCARLDAALLLCCLSPTAGASRDAADTSAAAPTGMKAAALKAVKGSGSSSSRGNSALHQGAGSCLDMGSQGPASSRLSARASSRG
jgi:hypothetical protein